MTARSTSSPDRFARTATSRRITSQPDAGPVATPRPIGRTGQRASLVRTTVDLTPAEHRQLKELADWLAADLDLRDVPRRAIHRALLHQVFTNKALRDDVRDWIANDREE